MLAYLFAKDALKEYRDAIPPALVNLLIAAIMSAFLGSAIRSDKEDFERRYKHWALEQDATGAVHVRVSGRHDDRARASYARLRREWETRTLSTLFGP